jgi:iron(III) transport system substrate-binding protein
MKIRMMVVFAFVLSFAACGGEAGSPEGTGSEDVAADGGEVNVYSHRHYDVDERLFSRFTELTGIRVNVQTASADELITRLENEGADSPADVLVTVDAGRLSRAQARGLLQSVTSEVLEANVPENLREPEGHWFGLTQRARVIVYHKDRVSPEELSTYEDLADPRWRGRVLMRSSENIYNQSLLASMIAAHGDELCTEWAAGVVANMAREPRGGDRDQIRAIAAGEGDVAVVNTYYFGRMQNGEDQADREIASQMGVFFPNQDGRGAHVNVSGAGVTAHAPNRANALRLIEFLTGEEAQGVYAEANFEYPVNPRVPAAEALAAWGDFAADGLSLARLGELNRDAVMIFDRAGWR